MIGDGHYDGQPCPIVGAPCASTPKKASISGVAEISLGYWTALARLQNGQIVAWGKGDQGQLGNGANGMTATPSPVTGFP
jgi:alpha-tubulin suppressor-like RCC1 family protein